MHRRIIAKILPLKKIGSPLSELAFIKVKGRNRDTKNINFEIIFILYNILMTKSESQGFEP
jgi:hypothetical protein